MNYIFISGEHTTTNITTRKSNIKAQISLDLLFSLVFYIIMLSFLISFVYNLKSSQDEMNMNLQSEITNYGVFSVVYLDKSLDSIDYNTQTSIFINSTSPSTNNCKYYYFLSNQLLISSYPFSFLATDSNYESVISFKPIKPTIVSTNIINNPPIECDSYYEVYSDPYE